MSTKVWTAYRLKPSVAKSPAKFWQWVRDTNERGEKEVIKVLRDCYSNIVKSIDPESDEYKENAGYYPVEKRNDYRIRLSMAQVRIRKAFKEASVSSFDNPMDLTVDVTIREYRGNLYVIPYANGFVRNTVKFMKRDPRLEDFCYWNNVDPPSYIRTKADYRRWEARGKVWDAIDNGTRSWRDYLLITICDFKKFEHMDPWLDLTRKSYRRDKKTLVSGV
jgi:hypothetical protein